MTGFVETPDAPLALAAAGTTAIAVAFLVARMVARAGVLMDEPNDRSSHRLPTPRSGGVAIFAGWATAMAVFAAVSGAPGVFAPTLKLGLIGAGVVLVGLADDFYSPSSLLKLAGQVAAGVAFVLLFGAPETAPLPGLADLPLGDYGAPLAVFWIVAFMNAFNFRDGVNGMAASCGAFVLAALAVASAFLGAPFWAASALFLALALFAFLPLNFPYARLFMGDNGSQTIGLLIAAIALGAARDSGGSASLLFAPVAVMPLIFDVSFTLANRMIRKQNILRAHCEHLYQLLVRLGRGHVHVTALYVGLTAISTAGAILMLRLAPGEQWYVPVALALIALGPATILALRARRAGLFEAARPTGGEEEIDVSAPSLAASAHAAE
ncbi:MAG TPA: hypothetical protein VNH64_06240 [Parvularculaceae bacterium]|nr:hypothetical protein [Parvularculaceae bacterium]